MSALTAPGVVSEKPIRRMTDLAVVDDPVAERQHAGAERDVQRRVVRADPPEGEDPHTRGELVAVLISLHPRGLPLEVVQPTAVREDRHAEIGGAAQMVADGQHGALDVMREPVGAPALGKNRIERGGCVSE